MNPPATKPSIRSSISLADGIGILLLVVVLLTLSYFRSRHCMFWGDEIMGWIVLKQPTWAGLLHLWRDGIDSSGIWFYVFGRSWMSVFGDSELSLRLFSASGIALAVAILWITARRFYSTLQVAASISFVFAFMGAMRWQITNGRTYGILMLAVSLVLYLLVRGEDDSATRPSPLFLLAIFAAYGLLAGSHMLGILYAGLFFSLQLALDLRSRRFRPLLYLSAICSMASVVSFSRANMQATAALGKPSFWTPKPTFRDLISLQSALGHRIGAALFVVLLIGLLHLHLSRKRIPVYFVIGGFAVFDCVVFAWSRVTTSLYVDRYLLPFSVAAVLLLCELFAQVREAAAPMPRFREALPMFFLFLALAGFYLPRIQVMTYPFPNYTASFLAALPPGLPVIDTDVGSFVELEFYQHAAIGHRVFFPTDWQIALDPSMPGGVSGFHEMDNWKNDGLYADDIQPTEYILSHNHDFLVLSNQRNNLWLRRRILSDPRFTAERVGTASATIVDLDIWMVHTR